MSREIDRTKPLSKKDREYLLARGREQEVAQLDADFGNEPEDDEDEESYEKMTVDELKAELADREPPLPVSGTKAELIKRLEEDDEG